MFTRYIQLFKHVGNGFSSLFIRNNSVNKSALSKLRKMTGFSFTKCKEALLKFDDNVDEANKWLKAESLKNNWIKMGKLCDRPMSNGLVGLQIKNEGNIHTGVMVELNCETDFVARNQNFHKLLHNVTQACFQHFNQLNEFPRLRMSADELNGLIFIDNENGIKETVANLLVNEVGSLCENMQVRRAVCIKADNQSLLASYTHLSWQDINKRWKDTQLAKYCAIIQYRPVDPSKLNDDWLRDAATISRQMCQHIVGMNPTKIGDPTQDSANTNIESEDVLIYQQYLLDENLRVKDVLDQHGLVVEDFVRFNCGEELTQ